MFSFLTAALLITSMAVARAAPVSPDVERQQVSLINAYRVSHDRAALTPSGCLTNLARAWAQNMASRGTISHNPNVSHQMTSNCNGSWSTWGENVGMHPNSSLMFDAFLASAEHRANIEDARFNFVGVGSYVAGNGTIYVAQVFARCGGCGRPWTIAPPGSASDVWLMGDWDGDGTFTPGVRRGKTWFLSNDFNAGNSTVWEIIFDFGYGNGADVPFVGDWDGDGTFTPGLRRGKTWYLSNTFGGPETISFDFGWGDGSDQPVVGDWNGDGTFTQGVHRGTTWFLSDSLGDGTASIVFDYGLGDGAEVPVVGDWNGDGIFTQGVRHGTTWYLSNTFGPDTWTEIFDYGTGKDDQVLAGDFDGNGTTTPAFVRGMSLYRSDVFGNGFAPIPY